MERLINTFGKNAYGEERTKLIWREVKGFSFYWWQKTTDHLILECRQAPLLEQFGPLIAEERERLWKIQKKIKQKEPWGENHKCNLCRDIGTLAMPDENGILYAYRCYCPSGREREEKFPVYSEHT